MKKLKIIFMGTPSFAKSSLEDLVNKGYNIVAVITAPDKPSGRGQKVRQSSVKEFSLKKNLKILQPENLKDEKFIKELSVFNADLQVVVAFRKLPKIIWEMPKYGTFNLHASLLPKYRGAAPINWAIINGEKETGVTTFFINESIDTGNILFQEKTKILDNDNAGTLHDKLMNLGSKLICKTIDHISTSNTASHKQTGTPSQAPKIFKNDCEIDWNNEVIHVQNKIRGLSPYPAAWSILPNGKKIKIFNTEIELIDHKNQTGQIITDNKTFLKYTVKNGFINILELQLEGRKKVLIEDFLRGYKKIESK